MAATGLLLAISRSVAGFGGLGLCGGADGIGMRGLLYAATLTAFGTGTSTMGGG